MSFPASLRHARRFWAQRPGQAPRCIAALIWHFCLQLTFRFNYFLKIVLLICDKVIFFFQWCFTSLCTKACWRKSIPVAACSKVTHCCLYFTYSQAHRLGKGELPAVEVGGHGRVALWWHRGHCEPIRPYSKARAKKPKWKHTGL